MGKVEFWRHRHAVIADGGRCSGCLRCVKACEAGALTERAPLATSPSER
jgi:ferredoxin